jgi:O-antigen/teichoic acid export membrane protein
MSRLKNFSRNLTASYLQLGVNVGYSLVSIPLILHWLPSAEFGLWVVLVQLMGYVSLVDLGMTAAVSRLLVDHKDHRANGDYGSLVKTAFLVSLSQGAIILLIVIFGAPLLADLMKISAEHHATFVILLRVQGVITAFLFSLRPLGLMLEAHQRMDVLAACNIFNLAAQLGLLWCFLVQGFGIYSFIYASVISALISPIYLFWNCRRMGFLPKAAEWGRFSRQKIREVFGFGMDIFLFNVGGLLIMSSQTIIISRCMGLEAAAAWSVGTKVFNFCIPLVFRPLYMSMPALSEMIVRNEMVRLRSRFETLVVLTGSLGVYLGISYALCNSLFVGIWTHNRIVWEPLNDALLALWLIILSFQSMHCNFSLVTKQIGGMRYIFFAEGCCFVLLAGFWGSKWGVPGIVTMSCLCTAIFSFQYGIRRSLGHFQLSIQEALSRWIFPCLKFALAYGATAIAVWLSTTRLEPLPRLCINIAVALIPGVILFLRLGCSSEMLREISARLPARAGKWLLLFTSAA